MGNEASTNPGQFTLDKVRFYQEKYKKMEDTIMTNNDTIRTLLQEKLAMSAALDDLKKEIARKDEEAKRRLNDVRNSRKALDSELNKYKSMPEFEAILALNRDLVEFQSKIKEAIEGNCDALQTNRHDDEIEAMKRRNAELYRDLKNTKVRAAVAEKSAELKEAEAELNRKKEAVRQEFLTVNGKLVQIKEKMTQATSKFAGTVEKSIVELRKNLQTYQKEMAAIEQGNANGNDSLLYERVKNILLQQQNALMTEHMASNAGSSSNFNPNPLGEKINNLSSDKKNNNNFPKTNNPDLTKENVAKHDASDSDNDSDDAFTFVDDASETSSVSGRPKTYKLILLNVHEEGKKTDDQKVRMVLGELTKLNLDDMDVRRVGKPTGKPRPVVVAFDSFAYIQELLKNRHILKNTKFAAIKVCPYKSKANTDAPKKDFQQGKGKPKNPNKNNFPQGKGGNKPPGGYSPF